MHAAAKKNKKKKYPKYLACFRKKFRTCHWRWLEGNASQASHLKNVQMLNTSWEPGNVVEMFKCWNCWKAILGTCLVTFIFISRLKGVQKALLLSSMAKGHLPLLRGHLSMSYGHLPCVPGLFIGLLVSGALPKGPFKNCVSLFLTYTEPPSPLVSFQEEWVLWTPPILWVSKNSDFYGTPMSLQEG